jgi:alanine racemase
MVTARKSSVSEGGASKRAPASRPNVMELDRSALRDNYRAIAGRLPPDIEIIPAIKADAYGFGAVEAARILSAEVGVNMLATGTFGDALAIRQAGLRVRILVYGGFRPDAVPELLDLDLTPTVYNLETARMVSLSARGVTRVHVEVDCGLRRLGVPFASAERFVVTISKLPNLEVEGLYTHVPFFDDRGVSRAAQQLERFDALVATLRRRGLTIPITQARASAALLSGLTDKCSAVSPGHLLFGLTPPAPTYADLTPYRSVVKAIKSQLIHVVRRETGGALRGENTPAGTGGYGHSGEEFGTIPLGLSDGYRPPGGNRTAHVLVNGMRAKVLSVSLEHTTISLDGIPAELGAPVTLVGTSGAETVSLDDAANSQDKSPLEVVLAFKGRITRLYV